MPMLCCHGKCAHPSPYAGQFSATIYKRDIKERSAAYYLCKTERREKVTIVNISGRTDISAFKTVKIDPSEILFESTLKSAQYFEFDRSITSPA